MRGAENEGGTSVAHVPDRSPFLAVSSMKEVAMTPEPIHPGEDVRRRGQGEFWKCPDFV